MLSFFNFDIMSRSGIILIIFSVFCCGTQFVLTDDQLEFWKRDPEFDVSRTWIVDHKENQMSPKMVKLTSEDSISSENNAPAKEQKHRFKKKSIVDCSHHNKRGLRTDNDSDDDSLIKYTKLFKPKLTSMTPKYLKQKLKLSAKNTTMTVFNDDDTIEKLNPYNLRHQLEEIVSGLVGTNATIEVLSRTAAYNDIILLKLTDKNTKVTKYFRADDSKYVDEVPEKKIIFIVHGLSVRGINTMPCLTELKQFRKLLDIYLAHLDKFDIFLIPMANPDGLSSNTLLWDKNMSPQSACSGVALDRNFDIAWSASITMSSCSQQYPGATPFSEPETKAIREVLHKYSQYIVGYFHVHAGTYNYESFKGDAVLYPKGYENVHTDEDKYIDLRGEIEDAINNAGFQIISVAVDTLYNWYGKVSGTSVDYASTIYAIPYAMELVMQPYKDDSLGASPDDMLSKVALTEIWMRVIDVIFNNISKNLKFNEI